MVFMAPIKMVGMLEPPHQRVASGYVKQFAIENGPVEIVDFPMKNGDFL